MATQTDIFNNLPIPKTYTQEILLTLITCGSVSIFDFPFLAGFRTRVSELGTKHNLHLSKKAVLKHSKFGNPYLYVKHILNENNKAKAVEIYKLLAQ